MSDSTFYSQPGYVLHQQPYRESSLIIDVLTQDFGRVSLLAKGIKKAKSKTSGIVRPFSTLSLSFVGRSALKTLTHVEPLHAATHELTGMALYAGFYINELVCHFLHKDDAHPEVFWDYHRCIAELSKGVCNESALRTFELNLLENIGYGLQLGYDSRHEKAIEADRKYLFNKGEGFVESVDGMFSGTALLAMRKRQFNDLRVLNEAKLLMRRVIDDRLQGKRLKSRSVVNDILKRL